MPVNSLVRRVGATRIAAYAIKIFAVFAFLHFTNEGFLQRIVLLQAQQRWVALIGFAGLWALSLGALLLAAFQTNRWSRFGWAAVLGLTTAVGFAYHKVSGSELGILDALSLWNARHEATRASEFYAGGLYWLAFILVVGFIVFAIPPVPRGPAAKRWLTRLAWVPALPIAAIATILLVKEGGGSEALPTQYAPLSVGFVLGSKLATSPLPHRRQVSWTWRGPFAAAAPRGETLPPHTAITHAAEIRRIVLLVDESVRADYIDWTPGNRNTPELARLKNKIVDFGPAASGGNCSHYSNAILRFAAAQDGLGRKLLSSPTLWQYAKKAGFRTVFIDGQAGFNRNPGKLQNFMTAEEVRDIDGFHALDESIRPSALDDRLIDIVLQELKSTKPVLIYANKNGAHFPYDEGYPEEARIFRPTMSQAGEDRPETRMNSYRNVVRWSVDRILNRLLDEATLTDTVIIYTSDHGQAFAPGRLTHCTVADPDPREGYVPLFVMTGNDELRARLAAAAKASRGHGSHFSIAPTVLELLGYDHGEIAKNYGPSLTRNSSRVPEFTSGDIFGLFANPRWHSLDLGRSYREPSALQPNVSARTDPFGGALTR